MGLIQILSSYILVLNNNTPFDENKFQTALNVFVSSLIVNSKSFGTKIIKKNV